MKIIKTKNLTEIINTNNYYVIDGAVILNKQYYVIDDSLLLTVFNQNGGACKYDFNSKTLTPYDITDTKIENIYPKHPDDKIPMKETNLQYLTKSIKAKYFYMDTDKKAYFVPLNLKYIDFIKDFNLYYLPSNAFIIYTKDFDFVGYIRGMYLKDDFISGLMIELNSHRNALHK